MRTRFDSNLAPQVYTTDLNRALPVLLSDGLFTYVWGLGLLYSVDRSNNVLVVQTDGLGSIRAITDGTGTLVGTVSTDAFGVPKSTPGTTGTASQPFGFTGQWQQVTRLVYLRARSYAPGLSRFMTRDSLACPMGLQALPYPAPAFERTQHRSRRATFSASCTAAPCERASGRTSSAP